MAVHKLKRVKDLVLRARCVLSPSSRRANLVRELYLID
jgi:hypothetical protein